MPKKKTVAEARQVLDHFTKVFLDLVKREESLLENADALVELKDKLVGEGVSDRH